MFENIINLDLKIALVLFGLFLIYNVGFLIFVYRTTLTRRGEDDKNAKFNFDGIREAWNKTPFFLIGIRYFTFLFVFWYVFFGFPILKFSQTKQYNHEVDLFSQKYGENLKTANDSHLIETGENLFNTQCVICHGKGGDGNQGLAANLVEFGKKEHVIYVIKNGSKGSGYLLPEMAGLENSLNTAGKSKAEAMEAIANYVISLSAKQENGALKTEKNLETGKNLYNLNCLACHGASGNGGGPAGNIPNFAADLTKYATPEYTTNIIKKGKTGNIGVMPAFQKSRIFSEEQYKALSVYVLKLGTLQ